MKKIVIAGEDKRMSCLAELLFNSGYSFASYAVNGGLTKDEFLCYLRENNNILLILPLARGCLPAAPGQFTRHHPTTDVTYVTTEAICGHIVHTPGGETEQTEGKNPPFMGVHPVRRGIHCLLAGNAHWADEAQLLSHRFTRMF